MSEIIKQSMADIWASIGDVVAPDVEKIAEGWSVEVVPRQYWNWMQNRTDTNLAYLFQHGIPEWDATVEYIVNKSYVTYADVVYKAILTGTNKIPSSQPTYWKVAFATSTAALEALKATTPAADKLPYFSGTTTATTTTLTPLARSLLDDTTQAAMLTTIGAQPVDATLTALAGVTTATNKLPYFSGVDTATVTDLSAFGRSLIDDADATAARLTLVLNNVDNTSDANKPVSTATQTALNLKAPLASPALTGVPTAPTAPTGTSSTQLATTAFVNAEIANDAPTKTGGGASGSWGISITGSAASCTGNAASATTAGACSGNAATATKLATARTINGVPFDGSANITIAAGETGRLPLAGGTMTGAITHSDVGAVQSVTDSWAYNGVTVWNMGREGDRDFKLWYYTDAGAYSNQFKFQRDGGLVAPGYVSAPTFNGALAGNASSATTLSGDQSNWASIRSNAVANMLGWKSFGNGHVIFDASNGTSPSGAAVNNTNSASAWSANYPTLMGWNGSSTYGVRVDSARVADVALSVNINQGSSSKAQNGYFQTFDGVIVQWGVIAAGVTSVTFPIAFPSLCAAVTTGQNGSSSSSIVRAATSAITTTYFGIQTALPASATPARYIAIGY